jgi:hypothetical protein
MIHEDVRIVEVVVDEVVVEDKVEVVIGPVVG